MVEHYFLVNVYRSVKSEPDVSAKIVIKKSIYFNHRSAENAQRTQRKIGKLTKTLQSPRLLRDLCGKTFKRFCYMDEFNYPIQSRRHLIKIENDRPER